MLFCSMASLIPHRMLAYKLSGSMILDTDEATNRVVPISSLSIFTMNTIITPVMTSSRRLWKTGTSNSVTLESRAPKRSSKFISVFFDTTEIGTACGEYEICYYEPSAFNSDLIDEPMSGLHDLESIGF